DLNRDAIRLQSPEAKLLKQQRDELDADWGFNLHDQSRYYSAGQHPKTAAFSFLAPAYNYEKEVNPSREDAMQLIGVLDNLLQPHLPGNVGRYNDDFEPRAFGDNIQKWGTRTVLIEVGGLKDDLEKQYLRKLHFMLFLKGLEAIADRSYEQVSRDIYESIPFNDYNNFHDLILREVEVENNGNWYTLDIAFKQYEVDTRDGRDFYQIGEITDVGDLSVYYGYEELQGTGLRAYAGKVYSKTLKDAKALERLNPMQLLRQGITTVRMEEVPQGGRYRDYPLHIIATSKGVDTGVAPGERTSLILKKGKQVKYAVVNGRLFALK
ncbi:MAG: peptidase M14, partial [Bacteroidota bacterium]